MKFNYLLVAACSIFALASCSPNEGDSESRMYDHLSFEGDITKKVYEYDDKWDSTGLRVFGTTRSGKTYLLQDYEYAIVFNPATPSQYVGNLTVQAFLGYETSVSAYKSYTDIQIKGIPYDMEAEKSAYYTGVDLNQTGEALRNSLNVHSFTKHTKFVKYSEVNTYKSRAKGRDSVDADPNTGLIEMCYTGRKVQGVYSTREHVWPCADSNGLWPHDVVDATGYYGGGSDLYHIRPCDSDVNSARGDARFVRFSDSEVSFMNYGIREIGDGGPYKLKCKGLDKNGQFADYVEVADQFKGDVARTIAYLYMHYRTAADTPSKYSSLCGYLQLRHVLGYETDKICAKKLVEWNNLDPVSEVEKYRNHNVQLVQGNRNPFVDYPDLMGKIFNNL